MVAPGLTIPANLRSLPLAFEDLGGKMQLIPIHHSTVSINKHTGANVAGALAGSFFYKPKLTTELSGLHARTILRSEHPTFYLQVMDDAADAGDAKDPALTNWALVHVAIEGDHRIISNMRYTALTGSSKRNEELEDISLDKLDHGWIRITPHNNLEPGEYALTPIPIAKGTFSTVVYDFTLDPNGASPADGFAPQPVSKPATAGPALSGTQN